MPLLIAAMVFASALMTATAMAAADAKHGEALYTTRCGA